ncbi:cytochrome c oxidase accessory protein CcoG [Neisseria sp. Ec49-e6-T10]|uniref:cytochrome c oxidase accessory protein CcoG n=1 Tax=Neisseria sp. Ec49-e6-T10 TaxID=3140744 RepID=UPI003EBD29A0
MSEEQTDSIKKEEKVIELYATHKKIHPKWVKGRFANLRILTVLITQLVYFGLPWLNWNNRQAFLLEIATRKFYIFGLTIWPQDLFYLSGLLICCALGLFWWTTIAGRLWCGYACPQTVYSEIMIWFDRLFEGDRPQRIKLDKSPISSRKILIKISKYCAIILFCFWTGFTFVGYFTPIKSLWVDLIHLNLSSYAIIALTLYAVFTFMLGHILREQVCKYMCPYARFQSAMFDIDTLIISYDTERGEPRGKRKKGVDYKAEGKGECIDCTMCVQVCPVGIDIRNGLQYECIGCAACIDVCDEVMDKMNYPRGLIRYTTEAALEKKYPESKILTRLKRPRVLGYGIVLFVVLSVVLYSLATRLPFKVNVIKDPSVVVRENNQGWLENTYTFKIMNTTEAPQKFSVSVNGFKQINLDGAPEIIQLEPESSLSLPVRVSTPRENAPAGKHPIKFTFKLLDQAEPVILEQSSSFIGEDE